MKLSDGHSGVAERPSSGLKPNFRGARMSELKLRPPKLHLRNHETYDL
jgi:hypothetical protein